MIFSARGSEGRGEGFVELLTWGSFVWEWGVGESVGGVNGLFSNLLKKPVGGHHSVGGGQAVIP